MNERGQVPLLHVITSLHTVWDMERHQLIVKGKHMYMYMHAPCEGGQAGVTGDHDYTLVMTLNSVTSTSTSPCIHLSHDLSVVTE